MKKTGLFVLIHRGVDDAGIAQRLFALTACATLAAMLLATLVARISLAVVYAQSLAVAGNVGLGYAGVWRKHRHTLVCAVGHGLRHGVDKGRTAIGIYRVVAAVVGYQHMVQIVALGYSAGYGKHYAVAKRNYGRFHVFIIVVALRNVVGCAQQRALELFVHKLTRYDNMLNAQTLAVHYGILALTLVLRGAVVKRDCQRNAVFILIKKSGGIHAARYDDY